MEIELAQVAVQVLFPNVVVDSVNTTLQDGKVAFHGVRRDNKSILSPRIFLGVMIHLGMQPLSSRALQDGGVISHQVGIFRNHLIYDWLQILRRYSPNMDGLNSPSSLKHGNNRCLVSSGSQAVLCPLSMLLEMGANTELSADIGFINFNNASEL